MGVQQPLRPPAGARHDMPGADFGGRADCEHESSVAQRGVDQPVAAPIDGSERLGGVVEGKCVGRESRDEQLVQECGAACRRLSIVQYGC